MADKRIVMLSCIDFRINRRADGRDYMGDFTASLGFDCFTVTRAGGVQDLVRPLTKGHKDSVLRDMRVGVKGHGAEEVFLANHQNCAAYAHFGFVNSQEEILLHHADLIEAREITKFEFPGIGVKIFFAELIPGTKDKFIVKIL